MLAKYKQGPGDANQAGGPEAGEGSGSEDDPDASADEPDDDGGSSMLEGADGDEIPRIGPCFPCLKTGPWRIGCGLLVTLLFVFCYVVAVGAPLFAVVYFALVPYYRCAPTL